MISLRSVALATAFVLVATDGTKASAASNDQPDVIKPLEENVEPITEPPCSYCSTQHVKSLIRGDDRVIAWLRAAHNGGAFPIRLFLAGPRVVNDTYGLFFYDPDGGYVAAYQKDYGYRFHGWRNGVMVVEGEDGTLWSALSGQAIAGPQQGARLTRIPSLVTDWHYWLMLHPESTTYDLFDGQKYASAPLPNQRSEGARESLKRQDDRLPPNQVVLGVEFANERRAYPLPTDDARTCLLDEVDDEAIAVFWYGATQTSVAFQRNLDGRVLTFFADDVSPESAPFKDRETGTRWTLAGRGVDGPLRGRELTWAKSIQCRWYAWASEYPSSTVFEGSMGDE
ncbi:MAG: DUF3179 domain-containing (seleno)protein [Planctomycetota bacterium]